MMDVEKKYTGAAPAGRGPRTRPASTTTTWTALACATIMSQALMVPEVEVQTTPWSAPIRRATGVPRQMQRSRR